MAEASAEVPMETESEGSFEDDHLLSLLGMEMSEAGLKFKEFCLLLTDYASRPEKALEYESMRRQQKKFFQTLFMKMERIVPPFPHVDLCKWLVAGGEDPDKFRQNLRLLNNSPACGLVWMPGFIAYRCRTCGLNPSMSLCSECFLSGCHEGHDFNMFRSRTGGACDCGDSSVIKPEGFCSRHGSQASCHTERVPPEVLLPAKYLVPQILQRLVLLFRELTFQIKDFLAMDNGAFAGFADLLDWLTDCGCSIKRMIADYLVDKDAYHDFLNYVKSLKNTILGLLGKFYEEALSTLSPIYAFHELEVYDCLDLYAPLNHCTLLEETMFWMVKFEFPQRIVNILLSLLTEQDFKVAFAISYAEHYGHLARVLAKQQGNESVYNRVVHISVQLFSNESLVISLVNEHALLRRVVFSLHSMVRYCLVSSTIQSSSSLAPQVVDCRSPIMDNHNYWAVALDLHSLLSSFSLAVMFLRDPVVLDVWMRMTVNFQGMNLNVRELKKHVDFESRTYSISFTAELELFSITVSSMLLHLKDKASFDCILLFLQNAVCHLKEWFKYIQFSRGFWWRLPRLELCFHYPLHRMYAAFMRRGFSLGMKLLVPAESFLRTLALHPLQIQVGRSEISCNMWVCNGTSMRYQSYLYGQSHYSYSFVDLDIYILQLCMRKCDPDWFVLCIFDRFHLAPWFSFPNSPGALPFLRAEWVMPMMEGALRLLVTLFSFTANLNCNESEMLRNEIGALISVSDRTHSQVIDHVPDRMAQSSNSDEPENILRELADYKEPRLNADGVMSPGVYVPKDCLWERDYDPLFLMHRTFPSADLQQSLDRYRSYVKSKYGLSTSEKNNLWPPLRFPKSVLKPYECMRRVLHCKSLHSIIFIILYRACREDSVVSEQTLYFCVYLLELAVRLPYKKSMPTKNNVDDRSTALNMQLCGWFPGDCILTNFSHIIKHIVFAPEFQSVVPTPVVNGFTFLDLLWLWDLNKSQSFRPSDGSQSPPSKDIPFIDSVSQLNNESPTDRLRSLLIKMCPESFKREYFTGKPLEESKMEVHSQQEQDFTKLFRPFGTSEPPADSEHSQDPPVSMGLMETAMDLDPAYELLTDDISDDLTANFPLEDFVSVTGTNNDVTNLDLEDAPEQPSLQPPDNAEAEHVFEASAEPSSTNVESTEQRKRDDRNFQQLPEAEIVPHVIAINESLLSLLIKVHDKISRDNGSTLRYVPAKQMPTEEGDSRIGDGPFFIRKVLDRAYYLDGGCRHEIDRVCSELSAALPKSLSNYGGKEASDRKQAARACQERLMAQFKARQKDILEQYEKNMAIEDSDEMTSTSMEADDGEIFECGVCNMQSSTSAKNPMYLLVHAQATNILSHQRFDSSVQSQREAQLLANYPTRNLLRRAVHKGLAKHFDETLCKEARGTGLDGSLYLQSCGHFMHKMCYKSYMTSLKMDNSQLSQSSLNFHKGEMLCPCCRRICNTVMPVIPLSMVYMPDTQDLPDVNADIMAMLSKGLHEKNTYGEECGDFLAQLWRTSIPQFADEVGEAGAIQNFVINTAKATYEVNALLDNFNNHRSRICNELILRSFSMTLWDMESTTAIEEDSFQWSRLTGTPSPSADYISSKKSLPLLLYSVPWLLVRFLLLLRHFTVSTAHIEAVCRAMWNVLVVQTCIDKLLSLELSDLNAFETVTAADLVQSGSLRDLIGYLAGPVRDLFASSDSAEPSVSKDSAFSPEKFLAELRDHMYGVTHWFLRLASSAKAAFMAKALQPNFAVLSQRECLIDYCLGEAASDRKRCVFWDERHGVKALERMIVECSSLSSCNRRELMSLCAPRILAKPKLIDLPRIYDVFFQKYHDLPCVNYQCCRQRSRTEAELHAIECGGGTGVFLAVNTSFVIIIRERRCAEWGSIYLDSHGEEDRGLGRGKPLIRSDDRLYLLQRQWLSQSFDFVCKRWNWTLRNPNVQSVLT
uniref:E3 ubiquitin-protein ligase n=1 Tax=Trichuris muris TaxID=70415 RepID=A0A5S6QS61_TRIMR